MHACVWCVRAVAGLFFWPSEKKAANNLSENGRRSEVKDEYIEEEEKAIQEGRQQEWTDT